MLSIQAYKGIKFLIGVIADVWPAVGRGPATSLFCAGLFIGTVLGPVVSGLYVLLSLPV